MSAHNEQQKAWIGAGCGISAFLIWGLSPLYWHTLKTVPALEIIMHRIIWSFAFLLPLILLQGRWAEFMAALRDRRTLLVLAATSVIVSGNWLLYIWSVNNGHVLQASLGYYINPLVNVLLGMIFLRERLRLTQLIAVAVASAGVLYLTLDYGTFPWVSLTLAFSFGVYGLIRKMAAVGSLVGLSVETLLLSVPALIYLGNLEMSGNAVFFHNGIRTDALLTAAALVTALPLLLFTMGTRRLNFSTIGFIQYIGPTCMFFLGVFVFGEPFTRTHGIAFSLIWLALAIYSLDSITFFRKRAERATV
ncbi:protein RarD [Desulfonema ishimotonii]|uniref:Protein RarD n=1 Tax=Desulfonema ishimotonii TaxID=45657 RepID=A0A401FTI1_9BACT|nr:EamA family transporter RarD [Desulfonema ishimotonii]GBC60260.1 protein RarD [Desulfonema ishimotonii]